MSTKQHAREIFLEAIEIPDASARTNFVTAASGGDRALLDRIETMLSDHFTEDGFMATPAAGDISPAGFEDLTGSVIGPYRLVGKLGEGGCGIVYKAEQEEPVRRRVALKVIKLGMDTRQVVARFEAERQALAMMDHPNIAKVLEAGATETGRPYFVMELVQGVPITEFCDRNGLSTGARIKLFISVCQAVQSAHQKGIIHRDLKPSNVLVTLHDGVPLPKVIDFGVAKAMNQRLTDKTLFTNVATIIGTPACMSPEQAEMSPLDVDTRSDIYSLGVLLYELLTGTTPFPEKRLRSVGYREMQRIILEEEPERPSTRLRKTALADARSSLAPRPSSLATDLDWIVMKCLEKERNRRYETANGLAADLSRHLSNEPVVARPPSAVYRFEKWVRRNKLQFAAVMIIGIVLVAASAVSSWQAVRAARAQRAFKEQAETAQSVKNFLVQQLLGGGGVWERRPFDTNNRVLVERITREVEGKFTNQPLVEAEIRYALGDAFDGMDDFSKALPQYEKAFAVRKVQLGAAHSETLLAASQIGWQLYNLGRHREADRVLDDAIAVARGASQIVTHGAAEALFARGWRLYYDGRPEQGMPYIKEALASFKAALGDNHIRVSAGRFMLAVCTQGLGRLKEAELLFEEGMRDCARLHGTNHSMVAVFLKGYALLLIQEGRYDDAIAMLESAVSIQRQVQGPDNNYTLESEGYLADALAGKGDVDGAVVRNVDLHRRWVQHLPHDHARRKVRNIADFFVRHRRYPEARAAFEDLKKALIDAPPEKPDEFDMLFRATAAVEGWPAAAKLCREHLDRFNDPSLLKAWVFRFVGDHTSYEDVVSKRLALASTENNLDD